MDIENLEQLPRDILVQILVELPGESLRRMCQTSKKFASLCRDKYFWALKAERDFGLPRYLFFSLKHDPAKLPYPSDKPYLRYFDLSFYQRHPSKLLSRAVKDENLPLLEYVVSHYILDRWDFDIAIRKAAERNSQDIVKYLVENHLVSQQGLDWALLSAVQQSQKEMVEYLLRNHLFSQEILDEAFIEAAISGHLDLVDFFLEKDLVSDPPRLLNEALDTVSQENRLDVASSLLDLLEDFGIPLNPSSEILKATLEGSLIEYGQEQGLLTPEDLRKALLKAVREERVFSIRAFIEYGISQGILTSSVFKEVFFEVIQTSGHVDFVRYLIETGLRHKLLTNEDLILARQQAVDSDIFRLLDRYIPSEIEIDVLSSSDLT